MPFFLGSLGGPLHTALSADGSAHFGAYGGVGGLGLHGGHGGRSEANHELEERVRQMEEDQDELNTSLMSLTSHFAKVSQQLNMFDLVWTCLILFDLNCDPSGRKAYSVLVSLPIIQSVMLQISAHHCLHSGWLIPHKNDGNYS